MKLNKIRLLHRCVNELRDRPTEKIKSQPSPEVSPSFFFYCNNEIYYILRQNIMFFFVGKIQINILIKRIYLALKSNYLCGTNLVLNSEKKIKLNLCVLQ